MANRYFLYVRKSTESEDRQVLSLNSQVLEATQLCERLNLAIVEVFKESKSAKAPGRPVFSEMMKLIEKGKVDGIVCWKLDRLARNPVDGGALIWALDQGKIKEIVTPFRTFKHSSDDSFLMQLEFGMAKKYVDDLSENVKRGIRRKIADGEPPGAIPIGYIRDPSTKKVIPDPERFPIIQQIWKEVLTGTHTPSEVWKLANNCWGLRTKKCLRVGGTPISHSQFYALLNNSFYMGMFRVNGESYPGKYKQMISGSQFLKVQQILKRTSKPRPQKNIFTYRGMMRCGSCSRGVTAEKKKNRFGYIYTYYHCSRKKPWGEHCRQPVVQERVLESQIVNFLSKLEIHPSIIEYMLKRLDSLKPDEEQWIKNSEKVRKKTANSIESQLEKLLDLRIREQINEEQYLKKRQKLLIEKQKLEAFERQPKKVIEPAKELFSYASLAKKRFVNGNPNEKRNILKTVSSNLLLKDKNLLIEAKKPFHIIAERPQNPNWWGLVDQVRTYLHSRATFGDSLDIPEL